MIVSRTAFILLVLLPNGGCFGKKEVVVGSYRCIESTSAGSGRVQQTSELVERGNAYLGDALRGVQKDDLPDTELKQSSDCFTRALYFAPDSYEAQLGLSVAYLARSRLDSGAEQRSNLLQAARRMLGRAYMLRHGALEPLYYLAEVAAAEGKPELAQRLLAPLRHAGVKAGPVYLLLGELSERRYRRRDAAIFYLKAISTGWPSETVGFAASRFRDLDISQEMTADSTISGKAE
jgi:hypothetical protein